MESSIDGAKRQGQRDKDVKRSAGNLSRTVLMESDKCESKSSDQLCSAHNKSAAILSRGPVYCHAAILPDQVGFLPLNSSHLPTMLPSS